MSVPDESTSLPLDDEAINRILNESLQEMGMDPASVDSETKNDIRAAIARELQQELDRGHAPSEAAFQAGGNTVELESHLVKLITASDSSGSGAPFAFAPTASAPIGTQPVPPGPRISIEPPVGRPTPTARIPIVGKTFSKTCPLGTGFDGERLDAGARVSSQSPQQAANSGGRFAGILIGASLIGLVAIFGVVALVYWGDKDKRTIQGDRKTAARTTRSSARKAENPDTTSKVSTGSDRALLRVIVSTQKNGNFGKYAVDGDRKTRWATGLAPGQHWIVWDLGHPQMVSGLLIEWASAQAFTYDILASEDGLAWEIVSHGEDNSGVCRHYFMGTARYLKVDCHKSTDGWFSIWEMQLLGDGKKLPEADPEVKN